MQVHYDARYEAQDFFHRVAKAFQLVAFAGMGAAAASWDLWKFLLPEAVHGTTVQSSKLRIDHCEMWGQLNVLTQTVRANEAFQVVAIGVAIQRGVLIIQYLFGGSWEMCL